MTQQGGQNRHTTTRRGTGSGNRRTVRPARAEAAADPPKPSTITYQTLDRDRVHGQAFQYSWTRGRCWGPPNRIQCAVNITSPPDWARRNIVSVTFSALDSLRIGPPQVTFHRLVVPQFKAFFNAVEVKGLKPLLLTHVGGYFARTVTRHPETRSNHAFGTAIDINAPWNPYGGVPAARGREGSVRELADFCADFGIYWGGWYSGSKDGMHFECVRIQSEAELRAACQTHRVDYDALFPGWPSWFGGR